VRRVAVLGDVHGNADALRAVLDDLALEQVDGIVWMGDLTWGWQPRETLALVRSTELPGRFVRGNAERALAELAAGIRTDPTERDEWMLTRHDAEMLAFSDAFEERVSLELDGLGATLFCHGSPRSDNECLTAETSAERITAAMDGVDEQALVTAHTHCQYDREVAGIRSVNAGSVGMPYEGKAGAAFWAILGPDVELRCTDYDAELAAASIRASGDPRAEEMLQEVLAPSSREELIAHAEKLQFSD
jgi:predicted phosphodiesterase